MIESFLIPFTNKNDCGFTMPQLTVNAYVCNLGYNIMVMNLID